MTWFLIIFLIFMNVAMGSKTSPSIIGTKICGYFYWGIQAFFLIFCFSLTYYAIKLNQ
jgi:hypothetical protein